MDTQPITHLVQETQTKHGRCTGCCWLPRFTCRLSDIMLKMPNKQTTKKVEEEMGKNKLSTYGLPGYYHYFLLALFKCQCTCNTYIYAKISNVSQFLAKPNKLTIQNLSIFRLEILEH